MDLFLAILSLVVLSGLSQEDQVELIPKMVRWPTHIDHYLCKQLHNGIGIRSHAVTNLNGDLCRTYCRIIDRMNGKITYTENITPNFVRCGNYQARCVDGTCVGLNFPSQGNVQPPTPEITAESSSGNETAIEAAEVASNSEAHSPVAVENSTSTESPDDSTSSVDFTYPISSNLANDDRSPPKYSLESRVARAISGTSKRINKEAP